MATQTGQKSDAISTNDAKIGFIGIGNMGAPMAGRLAAAGWKVTVYDTDRAKSEQLAKAHGAKSAASLADLARESNVIITMLPDGKIVRKVLLGESGDSMAGTLQKGTVVFDMSSSAPVGTRELGKDLAARGIELLDAPVSGGVKGALAGTMAIMVGGDEALAKKYDALLAAMGKRFYVGTLGTGHAMKVLNNYVSAAGLAAACEALIVGGKFGIDPKTYVSVINASSGRNNSTENKFAQFILNRQFNSGFSLGLMAKDVSLAIEVAEAMGVKAELGHATRKLWKEAEAALGGSQDHTAVIKHLGDLP